ncbi:alpha/beta hydrolase family protein [Hydrogenophaga soli]
MSIQSLPSARSHASTPGVLPSALPRAHPDPVAPLALTRAPQRPLDAGGELAPVRVRLPPPLTLDAPSPPAASAEGDAAKPLAIKAQVEDVLAQLPKWRQQQPALAQQMEELAPVFHHALLARDVYADQPSATLLPEGYTRLSGHELAALNLSDKDLADPSTGYFAAVYKTPDDRYVLANRGTTSGDMAAKDWKTNLQQGAGHRARQYDQAIRTALKITEAVPGQVAFVGHSKGGGLAQAQALATHSKAVVFNAAAVHPKTLERHGAHNQHANGLIRAYNVSGEVLSRLQDKTPPFVPSVQGGRYVLSAVKSPDAKPEGLDWKGEMGRLSALKHTVDLHSMDSVIESLGWQFNNLKRDAQASPAAALAGADRSSTPKPQEKTASTAL